MSDLAQSIADKYHEGQRYGESPYTTHLSAIANSVAHAYPGEYALQEVAWLHDILEDTDCPENLLRELFDKEVVDAVVAISRKKGEEKEKYAARVLANPLAKKVKLHDSFCNLRASVIQGDMRRVKKYAEMLSVMAGWQE